MAKRTTAQRRAAAKAAWARRRAEAMVLPLAEPTKRADFAAPEGVTARVAPPTTVAVTQDGDNYFLSVYQDGSSFRHRLDRNTLRTLSLDGLRLVG